MKTALLLGGNGLRRKVTARGASGILAACHQGGSVMAFAPYIHFQGNCAEALRHYANVFGTADIQLSTYADAPAGSPMPASDRIMYGHIIVDGAVLMASDYPPGMEGSPQQSVTISWTRPTVTAAKALFDLLAEGGTITMPFGETFWSSGFGMLRDRFGTAWMISVGPQSA
ncbi:MAG: VOC family protein [Paracoccaceae bacterium]